MPIVKFALQHFLIASIWNAQSNDASADYIVGADIEIVAQFDDLLDIGLKPLGLPEAHCTKIDLQYFRKLFLGQIVFFAKVSDANAVHTIILIKIEKYYYNSKIIRKYD